MEMYLHVDKSLLVLSLYLFLVAVKRKLRSYEAVQKEERESEGDEVSQGGDENREIGRRSRERERVCVCMKRLQLLSILLPVWISVQPGSSACLSTTCLSRLRI